MSASSEMVLSSSVAENHVPLVPATGDATSDFTAKSCLTLVHLDGANDVQHPNSRLRVSDLIILCQTIRAWIEEVKNYHYRILSHRFFSSPVFDALGMTCPHTIF